MADEFDRFLASALSPRERDPDRQFVAKVQAHIALEDRFAARQRSLIAGFVKQLFALAVITASIWWLSLAEPVTSWFADSPAVGLAILVVGFSFLLVLVVVSPRRAAVRQGAS
jgi:hypothetical protein